MKKYEEVMALIMQLIRDGIADTGEKVPSVRETSKRLQISPMTVLDAYRRLEANGIIEGVERSGFRVLPQNRAARRDLPFPETEPIRLRTSAVKIHPQTEEVIQSARRTDVIQFGAGIPASEDMPSEELSRCAARAARTNPTFINQYEIGAGSPALRKELARHMAEFNCVLHPDELITTSGITQGLLLALRSVTSPGDSVAVESPGFFGFFTALNFLNLQAIEIPSSPQTGLELDRLEQLVAKGTVPKALILAPTFANPTGAVMPDSARKRLIALAKRHRIVLIEDDTYGNLSHGDQRPAPLKTLDPEAIIYLGSFSKTLAPGYRIAWIAGGRYTDDIQRCHAMGVLALPRITQLALADYLANGSLSRHLRKIRQKYKTNLCRMQEIIAEHFPTGTQCSRPSGGHFLWVRLAEKTDAVHLARQTLKQKISIAPGPLFSSRQHYRHYVRLNGALRWSPEVEKALETVGKLSGRLIK